MAISFKDDNLNWGMIFYLKTDTDQEPHALVGVLRMPGRPVKYLLCHPGGQETYYYDFMCSTEKNWDIIKKKDNEE